MKTPLTTAQFFVLVTDMLYEMKGIETLRLVEPIAVRLSPHTWPVEVYGLAVSPKKDLHVMTVKDDGNGSPVEDWHRLDEHDDNADKMISSIYQRVSLIYGQKISKPALVGQK